MNKIVLDHISIDNNLVKYDFHTNEELKVYFKTDNLFIQYEEDMTSVPLSILTIPFVNIMAGFSWLTDSMLMVDEIDRTYYDSFKRLKIAYSEQHHTTFHGIFIPSRIVDNFFDNPTKESMLMFGGGVDCHTSFLRHRETVSIIINIYGWLYNLGDYSEVDVSDANYTRNFAINMGIKATHVRSNFAAMFDLQCIDKKLCLPKIKTSYWYGILHAMAFLSISAPIAFKKQIPCLIIASSDRCDYQCSSFITTDSEFSFSHQGFTIHDGYELSRQEKVGELAEYQKNTNTVYQIQACSFHDHNCCVCEKCFRTIVELVAENVDPRSFGFKDIEGTLKKHWVNVIYKDVAMWGVSKETFFYSQSIKRMKENYSQYSGELKEFVDWFLNFDFYKAKREGLRKYYRKNFFKIIKRKLHI